ncbi:hypothetical protein COU74_03530 [Candidatus Peregrinibacteria bacterium CG10_big_fil_rev_8_21_14_0_10_36_19]|nr:MAG: hypothetical protein COU74_03530 [Candidatus Peregrinibacteria bacterium CG10_big_fil_rev_8_21_14_0_10_36_19]
MIAILNNKEVKEQKAKNFLKKAAEQNGLYETLKTINKKAPTLKLHLKRLLNSAKAINIKISYKEEELEKMVSKIIEKSKYKSQRIRITVIENHILITSTRFQNKQNITEGVSCISHIAMRENPKIKSTKIQISKNANRKAKKQKSFDAILLDKNQIVYECAYANLFWFEKDTLCTRKSKVLPGITREIILKKSKFPIKFNECTIEELYKKDEVFLSSSLRDITPITKIDNHKIGDGKPGKKTTQLYYEIFSHS